VRPRLRFMRQAAQRSLILSSGCIGRRALSASAPDASMNRGSCPSRRPRLRRDTWHRRELGERLGSPPCCPGSAGSPDQIGAKRRATAPPPPARYRPSRRQNAAIAALHQVVCSKRRGPLSAIRTGLKPAGWSGACRSPVTSERVTGRAP
jgi:hypothetical protein